MRYDWHYCKGCDRVYTTSDDLDTIMTEDGYVDVCKECGTDAYLDEVEPGDIYNMLEGGNVLREGWSGGSYGLAEFAVDLMYELRKNDPWSD